MIRTHHGPLWMGLVGLATVVGIRPAVAQPSVLDPVTTQASASTFHGCAITTEGGAKCWGNNPYGQLGDGTTTQRLTPVDVSGLTSGVVSVAAGVHHTCAVTSVGGVKCWGQNTYGELGDGTTATMRPTAADVVGLTSGVVSVAVGLYHTCALMAGGGVKCWGQNGFGEVGDGTTTQRSAPVDVVGMTSGVVGVAAGHSHSCALTTRGGVKCWGDNFYGALGDGTTTNRSTPGDVSGLTSGVVSVVANEFHTCALTMTGGAKCWGDNRQAQLGDGTTTPRNNPVDVSGLTSGVASLATGGRHSCALMTSGGVKCWGYNPYGQVGDGTTTQRLTPVDASVLTSRVTALVTGYYHTCALTLWGGVTCWGSGLFGELGDGLKASRATPADVFGLAGAVSGISARGEGHTCASTTGGGAKCWGLNFFGQLGDGTTTNRPTAVDALGITNSASVVAGYDHTCRLTEGGGWRCWGGNASGQVGDGTTTQRLVPTVYAGSFFLAANLSGGAQHTCGTTTAGGARCWGSNSNGQLGDGTTTQRLTSVDVLGLTSGVAMVSSGGLHTCALTTTGGVKCWGLNSTGQLGDGTTTDRTTALDVPGLSSGVSMVAASGSHTCALTTAGGVMCWGDNGSGQLGDGTTTRRVTPVSVFGLTSGVAAIAAPAVGSHTCALTTAGAVKCWGGNGNGQLGDGTTTSRTEPVAVSGLSSGVSIVSSGEGHTCALTTSGGVRCWGRNSSGQLGDGSTTQRVTPVMIRSGQSMTFNPPLAVAAGVPTALGASASSGLTATFDTWTPGSCSVSGASLTAITPGLCGVRASQAGDGSNAPAPQALRLVMVALTPTVSAPTSASVTATTATLGGNVTADGGLPITDRGVAYALTAVNSNPEPGGAGVATSNVSPATGLFTTGVSGLLPLSSYSFKAYATNAVGTAYSSVGVLTTPGKSQVITFGAAPLVVVNGAGVVSATASSGLAVTLGTLTPSVCTMSGSTVSGHAAGTCVVAANQAGDSTYSPAPQATQSFPVLVATNIPRLVNISTRGQVGTGDNILIGGFIVGSGAPKKVIIKGRGPSMATLGVPGTLSDPAIRLFSGATAIDFNDDWPSASNATEITGSGQAPTNTKESAILTTVTPGVPYTVHVTGVGAGTGIAIVEVFELDKPEVPLLNISTRGPVLSGDQVMIGGFIIQGDAAQQVLIVAKGPSLGADPFNVPGALPDPTLELYQAGVAAPIETNDNWVNSTNQAAIQAAGNAPTNPLESAIIRTLPPGAYTAIVKGVGAFQGIGLVEVYRK